MSILTLGKKQVLSRQGSNVEIIPLQSTMRKLAIVSHRLIAQMMARKVTMTCVGYCNKCELRFVNYELYRWMTHCHCLLNLTPLVIQWISLILL